MTYAIRGANTQVQIELLRQGFDLQADRRLGQMQTLGGAGEIAVLGDGDEGTQLVESTLT